MRFVNYKESLTIWLTCVGSFSSYYLSLVLYPNSLGPTFSPEGNYSGNQNIKFLLLMSSQKLEFNMRTDLREVFMDFDPVAVSELNEKKVISAISLLSEVKLRSILDNARQVRKVL